MQFFVEGKPSARRRNETYPHALLQHDTWDDYGYQTTFQLNLHLSRSHIIAVGEVKILQHGQKGGPTPMPSRPFKALPDDYCSVGATLQYYERLLGHDWQLGVEILRGLRDVTGRSDIRAAFSEEKGWHSLLRTSGTLHALQEAPKLQTEVVGPPLEATELAFEFETSVGGAPFRLALDFNEVEELPGRINVLIGANGTGKTLLLAHLAAVAYEPRRPGGRLAPHAKGRFLGEQPPAFDTVLTVSYSAFDTFELPGKNLSEVERLQKYGQILGFVYCGLRKRGPASDPHAGTQLKNFQEIAQDLETALTLIQDNQRGPVLQMALAPLIDEPSFGRIDLNRAVQEGTGALKRLFAGASSGHKVVLNILVQLSARLQRRSLVLIDEPECHLHPPLLAAFLRGLRILLKEYNSYSVIATHSPVVLQATPRRYVRVLRRRGNTTAVESPRIETFAEDLDIITGEVFNLDTRATDHHKVLDELVNSKQSLEQIEKLFGGRMSNAARVYWLSREGRKD